MSKEKEFTFDFGNSSVGPVGAVIYTQACSAEEALEKAKAAMPDHMDVPFGYLPEGTESSTSIVVFFNPEGLTLEDIGNEEEFDNE